MAEEKPNSIILQQKNLTEWANDRDPTLQDILTLKKEVRENLENIRTTRGGGLNGHTALMMTNAAYLLISDGEPFEVPEHPGDEPIHAPTAKAHTIKEVNRKYDADLRDCNLYHNVQVLIKKQILQAVPKRFTEILEDLEVGYTKITIRKLMTHLIDNYGTISETALEANFKELDRDWDVNTGIATLISNQRKIQQVAATSNPITDKTLLMKALAAVSKTGLFQNDVETWKRRPQEERTYANFQKAFLLADKIKREDLTTTTAGYHTANAATQHDKQNTSGNNITKPASKPEDGYYCWSHGLMHDRMTNPNSAHNSATCKYPAKGHVKEATWQNMCGGNNFIRRIPKERVVFQYITRIERKRKTPSGKTEEEGKPEEK